MAEDFGKLGDDWFFMEESSETNIWKDEKIKSFLANIKGKGLLITLDKT